MGEVSCAEAEKELNPGKTSNEAGRKRQNPKNNSFAPFTGVFLKEKGMNRHHINSFNHFINVEMKRVLSANNIIDSEVDPSFYLKYLDIRVDPPTIEENMVKRYISPEECRIRNLTYAGDILVDVEYTRGRDVIISKNVLIGRIPIMLGSSLSLQRPPQPHILLPFSKSAPVNPIINPIFTRPVQECPYDIGGYFICKGVERVLLMQEQLAKNRILIETDAKGELSAVVTSSSLERKSKTKLVMKKKLIYLCHNSLSEDIRVEIILKGLGMTTDYEISLLLGLTLTPIPRIRTQTEALSWIGSKIKTRSGGVEEARIFLNEIILAHVPCSPLNMRPKAEYLAVMGQMLISHSNSTYSNQLNQPDKDDKDFVGNKRIELSGQMLSLLFEDLLKRLNSEIKKALDRVFCKRARAQELDALHFLVMNRNTITTGLLRAISTGAWSLKRFRMERAGVTQVLPRLSRLSALGMCSRVSSQFEKTRKVSGPRSLHCSQWGIFCPADTPEGEACGLVKSLATLADVTPEEPISDLLLALGRLGVEDSFCASGGSKWQCWVNGNLVGLCGDPLGISKSLREMRRKGELPCTLSVWTEDHLFLSTEPGRVCRVLCVVTDGAPLLTQETLTQLTGGYVTVHGLVKKGVLEYIDGNEAKNTKIAVWGSEVDSGTTHLEIDPATILGHVAGVIPFPHHNQSPRNTYQCAMGKQGVGVTGVDIRRRADGANFFLAHPQVPLITTRAMEHIRYNSLPAGQNLTVAVMSMSGYDIEDALVLSRGSLDRGTGRALLFKTHAVSLRTYPGGSADFIPEGGIPSPAQGVREGSTLVDRRTPLGARAGLIYRGMDQGSVERTILTRTGDDLITVKCVVRENRVPRVGDKFSSRHGQKGVVGIILPQEDMPVSLMGVSPDLIMNPHGFPSRMTVGKILELACGKAISLGSRRFSRGAGSAFGGVSAGDIEQELLALGFSRSGKEQLICGVTGKEIPVSIFFGPVFYQRLKHMVSDKMHARARGPRAILTRQPTEGRCRDGGFRLGEMERDCLIGYGASEILIERLVISSDRYMVYVCTECGLIVHGPVCNSCSGDAHVLQIPYACKLLFQELMSMRIAPRITLKMG